MQVIEVFNQLFHACHDGISAAVWYTAEEHIEVCAAVADTTLSKYPFAIVNS